MPRVLRFFRTGLRQKPRAALAVGLAVFAATALYTFTRPKIYEATASVSQTIAPPNLARSPTDEIAETRTRCGDMDATRRVAESTMILKRVADRLTADDLHLLVDEPTNDPLTALAQKRSVHPAYLGCTLSITISDSDRFFAARLANLFAEELADWQARIRISDHFVHFEDIGPIIERQRAKIASLEEKLANASDTDRHALQRDLEANRQLLAEQIERKSSIDALRNPGEPAKPRVYEASPPAADIYVSPSRPLHLGAGLLVALAFGPLASALAARRSVPRDPTSEA